MKKLTVALAAVVVAVSTTASFAEWTKIGPGPNYEFANARCNLMAMNRGGGEFVMGSEAFVTGYAIGSAIGGIIENAMLHGWKDIRTPKGVRTVVTKSGKVRKVGPTKTYGTGAICQTNPRACE